MTVLTILNAPGTDVPDLLTELGDRDGIELRIAEAETLSQALAGTDVLLMWDFFSTALKDAYGSADQLEWVHAAAAGVDSLLFDELVDAPVTVTNARGTFDRPIAEFVLNYILMQAKNSAGSLSDQRQEKWNRRSTRDITGTKAIVVGTGAIGREVARLLKAVGIEVTGAGSHARSGDADFGAVIDSAALAEHVAGFDWVIDIAPLTEKTERFIGAEVFAAMDPSAVFINVGRGDTVDTDALVAALRGGEIAGAGLDVFDEEPLPAGHPLWAMDNVIITPHMSGDTDGWRMRLAEQFHSLFEQYLAGEEFAHTVDKKLGYVR